jgi:hypothetical protein
MRRWIQICSVALAILAFAWINLDIRPRQMGGPYSTPVWFHETSAAERLGESLLAVPFAMLIGAMLGALVGAIALMLIDAWRRICKAFRRDGNNPSP